MKLSDYVADFLVQQNINTVYSISGGGIMHLLDSISSNKDIEMIYNLNEQATGICAESHAQYTRSLSACLVTTGPGGTNAITGCAGAWLDSTPVLFISGQTKTSDMGQIKGLRQYGAQEIAIVPMVKPITKYAITVMEPSEIKLHLEKAVYFALEGRKGPVWIDIPLDVQSSEINPENLIGFSVEKYEETDLKIEINVMLDIYNLINSSKRPVFLLGHGVMDSKKEIDLKKLLSEFKIPTLVTWRAKGIFSYDDELFMESPGIPAHRYSNYVLQNSDLLIVIGSRLNPAITAYDEENFAPKAKKIIVDIDKNELNKHNIIFDKKINSDAKIFIDDLIKLKSEYKQIDRKEWLDYCKKIKDKYKLENEIQPYGEVDKVDGYKFAFNLSKYIASDDIVIGSSSGRTCGISHMAIKLFENQKFITSMGLGAMGWCLPSAIGSCIASGRKRTIVLEGDGSLQHNIQELALIKTYNLPIKIFIYANDGYASIYSMQQNNFNSNFAGCDINSGVRFPDLEQISKAYDINYFEIDSNDKINEKLDITMNDCLPMICKINGYIEFDEIPKSKTIVNADGSFTSSSLEYLYPYISIDEHKNNMI